MSEVSGHKAPQAYIDALLHPMRASVSALGDSSGRSVQPPLTFTYRFESRQQADLDYNFSGWTAFTEAQKAAVRAAFAEFASFINVKFEEATNLSVDPDITLGRVSLPQGEGGHGGFRYAYVSDGYGLATIKKYDGFAVFDRDYATLPKNLILHEIAHALSLKHSGKYAGESAPGPYLPKAFENNKYSVMSYLKNPDNGKVSDHLMLFDIAALQERFGANLSWHTGNDVYRGPKGIIEAIWDAGGVDWFDGGRFKTAVTIDLREGFFSSLGGKNNLAIAYGAVIENGGGGSGKDILNGNEWGNVLAGRAGPDTIKGLLGNDTLYGGPGNDVLAGGGGSDIFAFDSALSASANVDRITDFAPGVDRIALDDAFFRGLRAGTLANDAFRSGPAAADSSDRVIYNPASGALFFDQDGNSAGAAIKFATLAKYLTINADSFFVF